MANERGVVQEFLVVYLTLKGSSDFFINVRYIIFIAFVMRFKKFQNIFFNMFIIIITFV